MDLQLTCTGKLVDKELILCFPLNSKFPVGKILKIFLGDHSIIISNSIKRSALAIKRPAQ